MTNRHADLNENELKLVEAAMAIECSIAKYCGLGQNFDSDKKILSEALKPYRPVEQITLAGITFDAPLREEPERGDNVYSPQISALHCREVARWYGYEWQIRKLKAGGYFATPEAAAACAKAFSKLVGGEV
jgi:hypothetical protein